MDGPLAQGSSCSSRPVAPAQRTSERSSHCDQRRLHCFSLAHPAASFQGVKNSGATYKLDGMPRRALEKKAGGQYLIATCAGNLGGWRLEAGGAIQQDKACQATSLWACWASELKHFLLEGGGESQVSKGVTSALPRGGGQRVGGGGWGDRCSPAS